MNLYVEQVILLKYLQESEIIDHSTFRRLKNPYDGLTFLEEGGAILWTTKGLGNL